MNRIKSNIIYNLTYQIFILLVPLITAPYLSRVLGVEGIGTYSYVSSIAYYFFIIITLGLNNYGNRTIAKTVNDKAKLSKVFWSIYFMQLIIGLIVLAAYFVYVNMIADIQFKTYYIIYLPYILSAVFDINWFYYGITEFKFTTIRSTIIKILSLVLTFIFIRAENDLGKYFVIMGFTYLLSNLMLWPRLKKYVSFYKPTISEVVVHVVPNMILFVPILAMSIYRVMDKIMIKELSNIVENGYYENADKIITMALTAFSAVATVMMPSISNLVSRGKNDQIKIILRDSMQISMFIGFGMTFGLIGVGDYFAPLFFGKDYIETGLLIQLLAVTVVISGWKAVLRSQFLIPYEKDKAYIISLVVGAIVNVILNTIFIPIYQAKGAVIGTICAEFVGFIIQTIVAAKEIKIIELLKDALLFIPTGVTMLVIVRIILHVLSGGIGLIVSIIVGVVTYLILNFAIFSLVNKERLVYLKQNYLKIK